MNFRPTPALSHALPPGDVVKGGCGVKRHWKTTRPQQVRVGCNEVCDADYSGFERFSVLRQYSRTVAAARASAESILSIIPAAASVTAFRSVHAIIAVVTPRWSNASCSRSHFPFAILRSVVALIVDINSTIRGIHEGSKTKLMPSVRVLADTVYFHG